MRVQKIEVVPIREAFRHEAHSFTVWLEDNIDALGERLGMELTVLQREKSVGSFNLDLFCEDENGRQVIIENQLEKTNHDHLGKLLTYLINLDASVAVWVATDIRPEHQRVIDWLNTISSADYAFYAVQVEAVRIGESPYGPLFTVMAQPDEQTREIGEQRKEDAERHVQRLKFWEELLERSLPHTRLSENRSPSREHFLTVAAGRSGVHYNYLIRTDNAGIELYIDFRDINQNKAAFDQLYAQKDEIEQEFGDVLEWERMDHNRSSRIQKTFEGVGGLYQPDSWPQLQNLMIDAMIRFDKAFRRRLRDLRV
jgi:hypothetical protein